MNQREFWRLIAEIDVAQLESGDDRVVLKVLEGEKSDSPTSRRSAPTSVEVEKDRARSARHYLKEYQRQRAGLDKRIRDLETESPPRPRRLRCGAMGEKAEGRWVPRLRSG